MCVYVHVCMQAHVRGNMNGLLWVDYILRKHMIWKEQMTNLFPSCSTHINTVNMLPRKSKVIKTTRYEGPIVRAIGP